jgi:hypothetical protein
MRSFSRMAGRLAGLMLKPFGWYHANGSFA